MAVISCQLDRDLTDLATVDELNIGTYKLRYQIMTDTVMGPISVGNQALSVGPHVLPSQWQTYSYLGDTDPLSRARDYEFRRDPQLLTRWFVTVTFRPPDPGEAPIGGGAPIKSEPNPLLRDPVIWWDREVYTKLIYLDKDNNPILNKIRDFYPDPYEDERARGILVCEIDVETAADVAFLQKEYDQSVNSGSVTFDGVSHAARTIVCREVSGSPPISEVVGGFAYSYFHVVFRFCFGYNGATWDLKVPEMGEGFYIVDAGTPSGMVEDASGHPVRTPVEAGNVIPLNEDGTRRDITDDPIVTTWRVRSEKDFTLLPFFS